MKRNTRDYGKRHSRFQAGFQAGGAVAQPSIVPPPLSCLALPRPRPLFPKLSPPELHRLKSVRTTLPWREPALRNPRGARWVSKPCRSVRELRSLPKFMRRWQQH